MADAELLQIGHQGRGVAQREAGMQLKAIGRRRSRLLLAQVFDHLQRHGERGRNGHTSWKDEGSEMSDAMEEGHDLSLILHLSSLILSPSGRLVAESLESRSAPTLADLPARTPIRAARARVADQPVAFRT